MRTRMPHVAGTFYPEDPSALRHFLDPLLTSVTQPIPAAGILLPHAGYNYSGKTACRVISQVIIPKRVLLIGPDHRGTGSPLSLYAEGAWATPFKEVPVNGALASRLTEGCPNLTVDYDAHAFEHSLEVMLPMLLSRQPDLEIVPILAATLDLKFLRDAAVSMADVLKKETEPVLVVISTDMSHYEPEMETRDKDRHALQAIEHLDPEELIEAVKSYRITMCGLGPVYLWLQMTKHLSVRDVKLVEYTTSAEASGDSERVVGYAGFIFR